MLLATAHSSFGGSVFMQSVCNQERRELPRSTCTPMGVAAVPADMNRTTVDGIMACSAVGSHLGCKLTNWDAPAKTLPNIPFNAVDGGLVVAGKPSGYAGVKRG